MDKKKTTVGEVLVNSYKVLKDEEIDSYNLDCELLLCKVLKKDRLFLILNRNYVLKEDEFLQYNELLELRKKRMPIKYILEECEFMGLNFYVKEGVLIPRPDTEILVEHVIEEINKNDFKKVCDVCCGSGAIGLSIAKLVNDINVYCSDISNTAFEVTTENIDRLNLRDNVKIKQGDLLKKFIDKEFSFDVIVSNPPYIRTNVIPTLMKDVKEYEPYEALCGGEDGLYFYREIANQSVKILQKGGMLAFEIGHDQKEDVTSILKENGFKNIVCLKDLAGQDRVVSGKK